MSRVALLAVTVFMLSGCSTLLSSSTPRVVTVGDNVCGREATQIYFGNNEDQLTLTAAQVVSELNNKLRMCPTRRIILLAVSGNDGLPATATISDNRIKIVGDILISQGIKSDRIRGVTNGPLVAAAPRGPIGGVFVMTE